MWGTPHGEEVGAVCIQPHTVNTDLPAMMVWHPSLRTDRKWKRKVLPPLTPGSQRSGDGAGPFREGTLAKVKLTTEIVKFVLKL